jgi:glycerophosphoryl diester phosphodiesterase
VRPLLAAILLGVLLAPPPATAQREARRPLVIAHRGASGYLPEHTLAAYAYAHALGADYIEVDLVLTRDGVAVAWHDLDLAENSDVASVFPDRAALGGRWLVADFDLAELRQLTVVERQRGGRALYPDRFPADAAVPFKIATLDEIIALVAGLNRSTGRAAGLYLEAKESAYHHRLGLDPERALLAALERHALNTPAAPVFLQSFEPGSLRRLADLGARAPLVQLVSATAAGAVMVSAAGLDEIATYAHGIGPSKRLIEDAAGRPVRGASLAREAHARGLVVHPYTFRLEDHRGNRAAFAAELRRFFDDYGVDGVFTDFTDLALEVLERR